MGDAAAAVVVSRSDSSALEAYLMETYADGLELSGIPGGGSRIHANQLDATPDDFTFAMQGKSLLKMVSKRLPPFLERLQPGPSEGLSDIDHVIPHQASSLGLSLLKKYGWPEDSIIRTLHKFGNCIAASIPATLYEGLKHGPVQPGQRVLLVGTGAGVSIAGAILTL